MFVGFCLVDLFTMRFLPWSLPRVCNGGGKKAVYWALICPEQRHLYSIGWNQCSHGLTSRPLESCHRAFFNALQAVCDVLGYPRCSALELLDGSIEAPTLHRSFHHAFSPLVFTQSRLPNGGGKRQFIAPGLPTEAGGNKGAAYQEHTSRCIFTQYPSRTWGIQRRGDGKDCDPLPPKEHRETRGEVGEPRNLFPRLGVG